MQLMEDKDKHIYIERVWSGDIVEYLIVYPQKRGFIELLVYLKIPNKDVTKEDCLLEEPVVAEDGKDYEMQAGEGNMSDYFVKAIILYEREW